MARKGLGTKRLQNELAVCDERLSDHINPKARQRILAGRRRVAVQLRRLGKRMGRNGGKEA